MVERNISDDAVRGVIRQGEVINSYPDDKPYPGFLLFGMVNRRPIHVVVSKDGAGRCVAITVYEPDTKIWKEDFKTKR